MKKFARVENSEVKEILEREDLPPFAPAVKAQFEEVTAGVQVGWRKRENGEFSEPTEEEKDPGKTERETEKARIALIRKSLKTKLVNLGFTEQEIGLIVIV